MKTSVLELGNLIQGFKLSCQTEGKSPVVVRDCDWSHAPFAKLLALPTDGIAVTNKAWNSTDEVFTIVVKGIRDAVSSN